MGAENAKIESAEKSAETGGHLSHTYSANLIISNYCSNSPVSKPASTSISTVQPKVDIIV